MNARDTHTPRRTFRYGGEDWAKVQAVSAKLGIATSELIRQALVAYVFEHGKDADMDEIGPVGVKFNEWAARSADDREDTDNE